MKSAVSIATLCAFMCIGISAAFVRADDAKEVTLKGTALCAKCELHQTEKCQAALKVTVDGKDVIYYITMDKEGKAVHKDVCKAPKEGVSVTGVVSEKDGQKWITASKVE
jgi:hypothetical protein